MDIQTLVAPVFGTNCYVVSATGTGPCVVIDAGGGVLPALEALLERRGLEVRAVLATHGHVDHTWSAAAVSEKHRVDLWIHEADAYRLDDPFGTLEPSAATHHPSGPLGQALAAGGCAPAAYRAPARVRTFAGERAPVVLDGVPALVAAHAPGHTQGATLFLSDDVVGPGSVLPDAGGVLADGATGVAFTGDVLFAGSVGRTDLPGGDHATMVRTLAGTVTQLAPGTLVLPGHGPASRVDRELARNPYLARR